MTFNIHIQLDGDDFTGHFAGRWGWLGTDSLVSEGNTLEQLIDSAEIFTCDQDGGEGPSIELDCIGTSLREYYIGLIINEHKKIIDKQGVKV